MDQPNLYSKNNSLQTCDNIHVVNNFLHLIKWDADKNHTALDVGCGEGYTTSEILLPRLPSNLRRLVGGDLSDKMVKFAKKAYGKNGRLDFCRLDLSDRDETIKFREAFNHVFSFYCLHWIPDQKLAFANIYRLLKPGGDMLLSFLGTNPLFEVYENISKNNNWAPYFRKEMISPYHKCSDPNLIIEKILKETGFENCQCIVEDRQYVFENWNQLKQTVMAINPILPRLSSSERIQYLKDFTEEVRTIYQYNLNISENNNEEKVPVGDIRNGRFKPSGHTYL